VVPPGDETYVREQMLSPHNLDSVKTVEGGSNRFESVKRGFTALSADPPELVLIHDGVRALVDDDLIIRCIERAKHHGGAIAAIRVRDTIKQVAEDGRITETPARKQLWQAQTPQVFRFGLFKSAIENFGDDIPPTDDAMLLEKLGKSVNIVEGDECNIKITSPLDLKLAEIIIGQKDGS
jgi:2-C-methyl-D-erythritol 4-phosphate cytidylyltransferase